MFLSSFPCNKPFHQYVTEIIGSVQCLESSFRAWCATMSGKPHTSFQVVKSLQRPWNLKEDYTLTRLAHMIWYKQFLRSSDWLRHSELGYVHSLLPGFNDGAATFKRICIKFQLAFSLSTCKLHHTTRHIDAEHTPLAHTFSSSQYFNTQTESLICYACMFVGAMFFNGAMIMCTDFSLMDVIDHNDKMYIVSKNSSGILMLYIIVCCMCVYLLACVYGVFFFVISWSTIQARKLDSTKHTKQTGENLCFLFYSNLCPFWHKISCRSSDSGSNEIKCISISLTCNRQAEYMPGKTLASLCEFNLGDYVWSRV